jgi:hypothetical protein
MKLNYKKSLKLITLLITSLLIATVSAQAYRYLYIEGSVSISETGLKWVKGDKAGSSITITGSSAAVSLSVSNGTTSNFTDYLYLRNLDASNHSLLISITNDATAGYYESNGFNLTIYNNSTGAYITQLNILSTSSSYSGNITESVYWHITFEVATASGSAGNSDDFAVQFRYE